MVRLSQQKQDVIRGMMSSTVENKTLPAIFFGATDANGEIFSHHAGTKVFDDPSSGPIDGDQTLFWVCSQTKLITSIAAMQLIEQGKIHLSSPVAQFLPELANPLIVTSRTADGKIATTAKAHNPITFGQLLNHTAGLDYTLDPAPVGSLPAAILRSYDKNEDSSAFFKTMQGSLPGQPIKFEPGTDFAYGYSTDCVGFIVERLSGKSLDQYFKDHIFSPLGITSASFYLTPALKQKLLPLSYRNSERKLERWDGQMPLIDQDPEKTNVHFGGAGSYMSLKDYLTLLRHLLQVKEGKATNAIITEASVMMLLEPTLPEPAMASLAKMMGSPAGAAQYGRGLMLETADLPGRRKKGSGSWGGWACTQFFIDPITGIAAVFGTQLINPVGWDKEYLTFWMELEQVLYAGLEK
ncbi:beta-lactamase/transpeptidase-like protein [Mycena rebaudengoi]|nr:beta-lactamase/transpeptidase-like protein [Mycena rebaudengoi]